MNKKKIIKIGIPVAAGCIVLALGIGFAVKNSGKAVKVAPVSSVNSGGWYDDSGIASYGTVTTNQKQDIYVDDTMPITQVYVKAGDTVKVGDRLVAYDTTLSSLELEMKEMQIQGIDLNIQNLQKEITQLKGTKTAKADTVASVVQTSADGEQQPTVQKMSAVKTTVLNTSKEDENKKPDGDTSKDDTTKDDNTKDDVPSSAIERPFPEALKGKEVYSEITLDSVPYNKEDADGTMEKPYRYLCAPGAAVNAPFMLKVLKEGQVCAFDVVDNAEAPTKFVSCWILDGKTGQVVIPDPQPTPDPKPTPNPEPTPEPEPIPEPEPAPEPDISEDPVIPDTPALPSKEEVTKQIKEKEQKIKDLGLSKRSAELELKKLKKKVGDGVIKSTVEGVVKEATDEASAKNENKPVVSVVGEEGFYVTGRVGETMLDQIKEGMTATVMSWQSGESYEATVTGVGNSPVSDYSTGENQNQSFYPFTLVIHGDANLSNGESVNLSMNGIAAGSDGSIYLEKMFVREEGNRYYVYKRGDNGRLTKQYVEVGKNMYNSLEITSGLTMDDLIAFPYGRDVKEGAKTQEADTLYDYY
ncbi:efflux RND transporter periplasmic adaptor subunit [Mediterraneibacter faecis]|uniref:efflux RND transporter periplasmic adaptor subunit n=1 Tax=Mediterraneibacter faecis TaxID=592978 RepID=UPI001C039DF4|nr:efflux RND transporter periplasmic adaptor subunit [Mediterraneibacter faecis]MBT9619238.1 HlyD family secretion protein [Mediterraneibacter faecis]